MIALYRRICSRIADHILQREILHRGRGQVNLKEGRAILAEYELWIETCYAALSGVDRNRVMAPWLVFLQAATMVSVEGEARDRLMHVVFGATTGEWEDTMVEIIGVSEMAKEVAAKVLRIREDYDR
jgi:hypothetical protein